jgi:hypothetical protein
MKTYLVKVDDAMYAKWQAQAKRAGVKLAELIRMRMNGDAKATHKNARRTRDTKPRRQRTRVAAQRIRTPDSATVALEVQKRVNELRQLPDLGGAEHHPNCGCALCDFRRKHPSTK